MGMSLPKRLLWNLVSIRPLRAVARFTGGFEVQRGVGEGSGVWVRVAVAVGVAVRVEVDVGDAAGATVNPAGGAAAS